MTEPISTIKNTEFQYTTSFVLTMAFLSYNVMDTFYRVDSIIDRYPVESTKINHIRYFGMICIEIYFWTIVMSIVSFVALVLSKILIIDIIKGDSVEGEKITINDVMQIVFGFYQKNGLFLLKLLMSNVLIGIFYGLLIADNKQMHKNKLLKNTFTKLFLIILFVQIIFVTILHLLAKW